MTKYVSEILKEINEEPAKVAQWKDSAPLKILFGFAYRPEGKMLLPEGEPPYKKDAAPIGLNPTSLLGEIKKLYVFLRKDITNARREQLFIQLLESVHPDEAKILLAVKDQDLSKVYKKITHKFAYDNGFIPNPPPEKTAKKDGASTRTAS